MNPFQHGEVFVTDDGAETDLDLGPLRALHRGQAGQAEQLHHREDLSLRYHKGAPAEIISGGTVQVIPHITDEIKDAIRSVAEDVDVAIIEIGGTIGDIESLPFLEAIRQFRTDVGKEHVLYIHLTLVPYIATAGEVKTKPTQHSVKELRSIGIQPDILLCRTDRMLTPDIKAKIAMFCNVGADAVITAKDVSCIYEVPLCFHQEGLDNKIVELLNIWTRSPRLEDWEALCRRMNEPNYEVTIAIVGKYVDLTESYKSLNEALIHGGIPNRARVNLKFVDSETIDGDSCSLSLEGVDGILVPGGFGSRGVEGKICAARYAREKQIPYFGICLGMQIAVIEFARHVAELDKANSTEFDLNTPHPVIYLMEEWFDDKSGTVQQRDVHSDKGGTMRLGAYPCKLEANTVAYRAYGMETISERHRHRFEFNNAYMEPLKTAGLNISGMAPSGELVEIIEIGDHPWYLGCQFHPEFKSRPMTPHPLFRSFIAAALEYSGNRKIEKK
jgi:CTP synthase